MRLLPLDRRCTGSCSAKSQSLRCSLFARSPVLWLCFCIYRQTTSMCWMFISIYLSIYLSIYVSIYLCMYVCMHVSIYLSIYLCMYIRVCICICIYIRLLVLDRRCTGSRSAKSQSLLCSPRSRVRDRSICHSSKHSRYKIKLLNLLKGALCA